MYTRREPDHFLPRWKKNEIKRAVKAGKRESSTDLRRWRRNILRVIRRGEFDSFGIDVPKPGKFVSKYRSSRAFKNAYAHARMDAEYDQMAMLADY